MEKGLVNPGDIRLPSVAPTATLTGSSIDQSDRSPQQSMNSGTYEFGSKRSEAAVSVLSSHSSESGSVVSGSQTEPLRQSTEAPTDFPHATEDPPTPRPTPEIRDSAASSPISQSLSIDIGSPPGEKSLEASETSCNDTPRTQQTYSVTSDEEQYSPPIQRVSRRQPPPTDTG